jgi:orotate phosphoribosyltransferase
VTGGALPAMQEELLGLLAARKGHFRFESGHHGDLWLELDTLFLRPARLGRYADELARRLSAHRVDAICGPLVGGAFLAEMIAAALDVEFCYSARETRYRLPRAFRDAVRGRRVAVADDVINAGSAVRGTLADLQDCGATPVAIGALLVLGSPAADLAAERGLPLEPIASRPNLLWSPSDCPLCAAGLPLERPQGFS